MWGLMGCVKQPLPQTGTVEVVRGAPDEALAWAELSDGAESLEVPTRRRALYLLVELSEPEASQTWAARALWDPNPRVQKSAVSALDGRLPEASSLTALQDFVQREGVEPYTRCAAAAALARQGDVSTLPAVQAAMEDEIDLWRQAPCSLAAAQMNDTAARQLLSEIIASGELPLELGFASDMGRSGLEGLGDELVAVGEDLEPELQIAVATAALMLGASEGEDTFKRALSDTNIEQQLEALDFLLTLPPALSVDLLRRAGGSVKTSARLALVELGEEEPEQAVQSLLALDRETRAEATRAIGGWLGQQSGGARRMVRLCQDALVESLQDPEDMVRLEALRAIAVVGRHEDAGAIAPLLEADALQIRIEAAAAMIRLRQRTASE